MAYRFRLGDLKTHLTIFDVERGIPAQEKVEEGFKDTSRSSKSAKMIGDASFASAES